MTSSDPADGTLTIFFSRLKSGEASAARGLWEHFCPRLLGLANRVFGNRRDCFPEAEEAVLSAFASFCQAAQLGSLQGDVDRESLWRLLKTFTVRKAIKQIERDRTQKRGAGLVVSEGAMSDVAGNPFRLDEAVGNVPSRDFDLHTEELLNTLSDDELRTIALCKLMGYTNREISERLDCTERRIERKLNLIRLAWQGKIES